MGYNDTTINCNSEKLDTGLQQYATVVEQATEGRETLKPGIQNNGIAK